MLSNDYLTTIGIEIHVQLATVSKIFSADATTFEAGDNENTTPVSVGMPGTLPVLNKKAVEYAIKTGLALGCDIREVSVFSRKNYFYPDLPKGYQISQYDQPLCENGVVKFRVKGVEKSVDITRAHMEEDAGKSQHQGEFTLINYNRAGIPLLEIVSAPVIENSEDAAEYCRTIRQIVRYLGVCDGNLEEGSLRCDVNVSVRPKSQSQLGTKVEIKNINSFRFIEKAIEYEVNRQTDVIERGEKIIQETRLWDPDKNRTVSMRTKEDAQDYRYFPDPDLLPLKIPAEMVQDLKKTLPELPYQRMLRFQQEHQLPDMDSEVLTQEKDIADYYEQAAQVSGNFKATSNWIMTEVLRELNTHQIPISRCPITPKMLGEMIALIEGGKISGKMAKTVFQEMWDHQKHPDQIIAEKGLVQITDPQEIEKIIDQVLGSQVAAVADYQSGKKKNLFGFFVGAVMKASRGQANPELVNEILKKKLDP